MRTKTVISLVIIVLACALLVAACFYLFPTETTPLNATLKATKLDVDGNVLGTTQIELQGAFKAYLFRENMLELSVAPFDEIKTIILPDSADSFGFTPIDFDKFFTFSCTAWENESPDMLWINVHTSQDFEYWVFRVNSTNNDDVVYYVASRSGNHSVEEVVQFFQGLAPGYKAH